MIKRKSEMTVNLIEKMRGGEGHTKICLLYTSHYLMTGNVLTYSFSI